MGETQEYRRILAQIVADAPQTKDRLPVNDSVLLKTVEKERRDQDPEYVRRNQLYSELLAQYIGEYHVKDTWKKWYRVIFFGVTMVSFIGIIVCSLIVLFLAARKAQPSAADLGAILGSVAGILSAILVLPKIIAEHLFPKDEDSNMISMVKNMQLNDSAIRQDWSQGKPAEQEASCL